MTSPMATEDELVQGETLKEKYTHVHNVKEKRKKEQIERMSTDFSINVTVP